MSVGVVEGFFGPAWPMKDRLSYAEFLATYGAEFYIYAPKRDPHLRKAWRQEWGQDFIGHLKMMASHFKSYQIQFGVGFSPFELGTNLTDADKNKLKEKVSLLQELGVELLGLFFDDMPVTEGLAQTQLEALNIVREGFKNKIIFCPSFYTPDPILEKVFGKKPEHYLEDISEAPSDVALAWTGPKVISPVMPKDHLLETTALLKRKPYIWENLFANDGPKNCKFLKLKPFTGRDPDIFPLAEAFAFNLMNQAQLSKIVLLASIYVLKGEPDVNLAYSKAVSELCSPALQRFLFIRQETLLTKGLDNISEELKESYLKELSSMSDPIAFEISDWLRGNYNVGPECLTD